MSIIRDALEWIDARVQPMTYQVDGKTYSRDHLSLVEPPKDKLPNFTAPFETRSLSSVVEYIKRGVDQRNYLLDMRYIIHIVDHKTVLLTTETLRDHEARVQRVVAKAQVPEIKFGEWVSREQLNIMLQTMFVDNEQRRNALEFIGRIAAGTSIEEADDGVGQSVTVKQGISGARKGKEDAPAAFILAPFRTFSEADQPTSPFILRLKSEEGVRAALFEADGGAWKVAAMRHIKNTLESMIVETGGALSLSKGTIVILA